MNSRTRPMALAIHTKKNAPSPSGNSAEGMTQK